MSQSNHKIIWKVPNFGKKFLTIKDDPTFDSEEFVINFDQNYAKWHFVLRPNSWDQFRVYVVLVDSSCEGFNADVSIKLIGKMGKCLMIGNLENRIKSDFEGEASGRSFPHSHNIRRSLLNKFDSYVVEGKLKILVEISIKTDPTSTGSRIADPTLSKMFDEKLFADIDVIAKGKIIKCHKAVLAYNSPVIKKHLDLCPKTVTLLVTGHGFDVVEAMIRFMYFHEVLNLDEIAPKLFYAAHRFEMNDLKAMCTRSIIKNLNPENVLEALMISYKIFDNDWLFNECFAVIKRNIGEVRSHEAWKQLPGPLMEKIAVSAISRSSGVIRI